MVLVGVLGVAFACGDAAADEAGAAEVHALFTANEGDAALRASGDRDALKRDDQRAKEAKKLDGAGKVCTPAAKMEAAWVMLQADDVETLDRASALAIEAMTAREPRAAALVPLAYDVMRIAKGSPQRYGTQFATNVAGKRCIVALEAELPESERAPYKLAPAAESYRKLLDDAGFPDDPPTMERLDRRGLVCAPTAARR